MSIKPIIFDLDDTLYPEITFVKGGFLAVAQYLNKNYKLCEKETYNMMIEILNNDGRGAVFNKLLFAYDKFSMANINRCISLYRNHEPNIKLYDTAERVLKEYKQERLFLVTDGNKFVQSRKVKALNLDKLMSKVFITHRYGMAAAKPSLYCFEKIKNLCGCEWNDITYIGDNPKKDFVKLKQSGAHTIRVKTGYFAHYIATSKYDADITIQNLDQLRSVIR